MTNKEQAAFDDRGSEILRLRKEIDRLRHALYCIKVEYAYCTQCSASALAEMALEQKP